MKRSFVLFVVGLVISVCACAQKKIISQAQTYIKSGSNLDKAESSMRELLKDSDNINNMKIWNTLTEAIRMQYEQGNEKLYLKQKYDTAALFLTAHRMFLAYEAMDSIDAMPDKKGRVELKFRKRNASYLNKLRPNLYNGGLYFISKQNYKSAFTMFSAYIGCAHQPIFSAYKIDEKSRTILSASYLATFCGAKLHDNAMALIYADKALRYEPGRENTLQYLANIYQEQDNIEKYSETLQIGIKEFPKSEFFFTRIIDYYNGVNKPDTSLAITEYALHHDPQNTLYMYAKSNIMLNMGRYSDCVAICDSVIALNDSLADVYYNAGVACINLAVTAQRDSDGEDKAKVKKYYKMALPYMEKYRLLAPDQKDKWSAALYNIYLNLNMGKKFEEITRIIQKG